VRAGLRPFGVSFLYAGWDRHYGFQLYHSDPSGNYAGWRATCIGANDQVGTDGWSPAEGARGDVLTRCSLPLLPAGRAQAAISILKQSLGDNPEEINLEKALAIAVKVLSKTMDSTTLTADKRTGQRPGGRRSCGRS